MSTIGTPAPLSLTTYADTQAATGVGGDTVLGQQDFLALLTAQLQNQDPFAPMENTEFLGQMAQFSTLSGIEQMNGTLVGLDAGLGQFRVATATSFLGQQVLVPGTRARPGEAGEIAGVVDLATAVNGLSITYSDAETGEVLNVQELGSQPPGLIGFSWDELPDETMRDNSLVRVTVSAETAEGTAVLTPSVYADVTAVEMSAGGGEMLLQIQDYGPLNSLEVTAVR
ncbi:flagellar basal-body rod modification protein FlgD [Rhodovulum bhavnagarense]|uniref:Basal-body rod modification protein FlgD n=1 Tax=Rhodovulum bhavnagarense TaxID=992286 RepID=A0A4R2RD37_9RHOB|nr:flagellar hook capping FlgD N-terminal domain-containing protein [Rhodovulum bhavnagarense]TCP61350.1 flagellar basal-body rod modification protein FlgD [Rhodovulum bhavnagarense]